MVVAAKAVMVMMMVIMVMSLSLCKTRHHGSGERYAWMVRRLVWKTLKPSALSFSHKVGGDKVPTELGWTGGFLSCSLSGQSKGAPEI